MSSYVLCSNVSLSPRLKDKNIYLDIDETSVKGVSFSTRMKINNSLVEFSSTLCKYVSKLKNIGIVTSISVEVDYSYFMYIRSIVISLDARRCEMVSDNKLKARFDMANSIYSLAVLNCIKRINKKEISDSEISSVVFDYVYSSYSIIDTLLQECGWVNIVDWLHNERGA